MVHTRKAPVHRQIEPADIRGFVTRQVEHGLRHVFCRQVHALQVRLTAYEGKEPSHGILRPLVLRQMGHGELRRYCVRGHAVHADPVPPQLRGSVLRETHQSMLGSRVTVRSYSADDARHASHGDDGALPPRDHDARGVLHPEKCAIHVNVEHLLEIAELDLSDVGYLASDNPGIVDHDVNSAELLSGKVYSKSDLFFDGNVTVEETGVGVATKRLADALAKLIRNINDANLCSMPPEEPSYAFPDPRSTAGY